MYYNGSGANDPAITKKIVEFELVEQYHWTYEEIQRTSYKKLQELFLRKRQKNELAQTKINIQKAKQQVPKGGSGRMKKIYREV